MSDDKFEEPQPREKNRKVEQKIEVILQALGYHTVRFQGQVAIVNQPARIVNLVSLFANLLEIADETIDALRFFTDPACWADPAAQQKVLELVELLKGWDNPLRLNIPEKEPKKGKKKG